MDNQLLKGNVLKALMIFAIPYMISNLLQVLYGSVDLLVVGQFGQTFDVSGVSIGSQVMSLMTNFVLGLTTGVTVLLGQYVGANEEKKLSKTVGAGIVLSIIMAMIFTILLLMFNQQIVSLMNTPDSAIEATRNYLFVCSIGVVFIVGYNVVSSILRGLGDSKTPLLFVFIACIINIVVDFILVGYFHMGAMGAAIATVLAQGTSFIFSILYLKKKGLGFHFDKKDICFSVYFQKVLKIGFPIGFQSILVNLSFLIITIVINGMGVVASASVGVVEKLMGFLMLPSVAFGASLSTIVAQNIGAQQYKRANQSLKYAIMFCLSFACIITTICIVDGSIFTRIFTNDQEVINNGALYLKFYSLDCLLTSFLFCLNGYLNGYKKTVFTMIHSLTATFLGRIPLTILISQLPHVTLLEMGLAAPLSTIISLVMIFVYFKKTKFDCIE